jgi:hypothetical protein
LALSTKIDERVANFLAAFNVSGAYTEESLDSLKLRLRHHTCAVTIDVRATFGTEKRKDLNNLSNRNEYASYEKRMF